MTKEVGLKYQHEKEIFLFSTAFRPALGPTQPPGESVLGAVFTGVKQMRYEAHH